MILSAIPDVSPLRSRADKVLGYRQAVEDGLERTKKQLRDLEDREELLGLVSAFLRSLVDREVTEAVEAVTQLLTEGLQAVFDDQDLMVRAQVGELRSKISVEMTTIQKRADGQQIEGVGNDAFGGAVVTVQSVLLRVITVLRRGLRPVLLLDESLPAFDSVYVENVGKFLRALCTRLNVDILLVTHNPLLVEAAHKAYRIKNTDGKAVFVEMES